MILPPIAVAEGDNAPPLLSIQYAIRLLQQGDVRDALHLPLELEREMQRVIAPDAPTIGSYLAAHPEVAIRREIVKRELPLRMAEASIRSKMLSRIVDSHESIRVGWRGDALARQLRELADDIESKQHDIDLVSVLLAEGWTRAA